MTSERDKQVTANSSTNANVSTLPVLASAPSNGILRRKLGIQQPVYATRGFGVLPKAAFGLACRYAGLHKALQSKKQISFRLDQEGLTTSSPELSQACAVPAGM